MRGAARVDGGRVGVLWTPWRLLVCLKFVVFNGVVLKAVVYFMGKFLCFYGGFLMERKRYLQILRNFAKNDAFPYLSISLLLYH